jgi:hypothetical protein
LPSSQHVQFIFQPFNKLLWLQNDLINRHYQESVASEPGGSLAMANND